MNRAERRAQKFNKQERTTFIHQEKRWGVHIREMVPKIYAGFALSLHRRYGFGFDRIVTVLSDTQKYWQQDGVDGFDILKTCLDETGINLISEVTARECGIKPDNNTEVV